MATTLSLLPFTQLRQFSDDGLLLSGGKLYFYKAGTSAPLATYQDVAGTIANTNPVILDGAGSAKIFLQSELYRLVITDENDVQIYEIDGIGSGSGAPGSGSIAVCLTYDEVRALDTQYDSVIVIGRTTPGDGGQGLFLGSSTDVRSDEDGIILVGNDNTRYIRVLDGVVEASWYGVKYSSNIDQSVALLKAMNAVKYGSWFTLPLLISGQCYINVAITVPSRVKLMITGSIVGSGTTPPTITFSDNAVIQNCSYAGITIPIKLGLGCTDGKAFNGNWLGGGDATEIDRIASLSEHNYTVTLGKRYTISTGINIPKNISIDVADGGSFYINNGVSISIPSFVYSGKSRVFEYKDPSYCLRLFLGRYAYPEWFGAIGDGIGDDSKIFDVAFRSGMVVLSDDRTYNISNPITISNDLSVKGNLPSAFVLPNPMYSSALPAPKINLTTSGSPYLLDAINGSTSISAISASTTSADGYVFMNAQCVGGVWYNGNYYVLTSPGYLYRIDFVGGIYTAVQLTNDRNFWEQIIVKDGVMYGSTGGRYRMTSVSFDKVKLYRFNSVSSSSTLGSVTLTKVYEDVSNTDWNKIIDPGLITGFSNTVFLKTTWSMLGNQYKLDYLDTSDWTSHNITGMLGSAGSRIGGMCWYSNSVYTISAVEGTSCDLIKITPSGLGTTAVTATVSAVMSLPTDSRDLTVLDNKMYILRNKNELLKVDPSTWTYSLASNNFGNRYAKSITSTNNLLFITPSTLPWGTESDPIISSTGNIVFESLILDAEPNHRGFNTLTNTAKTAIENCGANRILNLSNLSDSIDSIVDTFWYQFNLNAENPSSKLNNTLISERLAPSYIKHNTAGTNIIGLYLYDQPGNSILTTNSQYKVVSTRNLDITSLSADNIITDGVSATTISATHYKTGPAKIFSGNTYNLQGQDAGVIVFNNNSGSNTNVILSNTFATSGDGMPKFLINNTVGGTFYVDGVHPTEECVFVIPANGKWYKGF